MASRLMISMENAVAAFVTYAMSLIAALSWNTAVQHYLGNHETTWGRWAYALSTTLAALLVLVLVMHYHEDSAGQRANTGAPTVNNREA